MIADQKLKHIQALIKTATVLNEQEKIEWQALLELMNDKQIAELEEILQTPNIVEAKPEEPQEVSQQSSSLSHISNLPSQISIHKAPPAGPVTAPVAKSQPTKPVVNPQPIAQRPTPTQSPPQPIIQQSPPVFTSPSITPAEPITLTSLEDVALLSSTALHQQNRQVFYKTINDFAAQFGYFQVVTSFEQSPLYKDYLDYGKSMLAGQKDGLALSQEEFEFVTDILLSLKVNRF